MIEANLNPQKNTEVAQRKLFRLFLQMRRYQKYYEEVKSLNKMEESDYLALEATRDSIELENTKGESKELQNRIKSFKSDLLKSSQEVSSILEMVNPYLLGNEELLITETIAVETESFNKQFFNRKWSINEILMFLMRLKKQLEGLVETNIISASNLTIKTLSKLDNGSLTDLVSDDLFVDYILNVQDSLYVEDVSRVVNLLVKNQGSGQKEGLDSILEGSDPKSRIMEEFFEQNLPEITTKFNQFQEESLSPVAGVCDYLIILRILLQDQQLITLYLDDEYEKKTSIFKSFRAQNIVQKNLKAFFYEYLGINPAIPCNHEENLKLNLTLFKKSLIFLMRKNVIVSSDFMEGQKKLLENSLESGISIFAPKTTDSESKPAIQLDLGLQGMFGGGDGTKSPNVIAQLSSAINQYSKQRVPKHRRSENDFSIEYKLMQVVKEMRLSIENNTTPAEAKVCQNIIRFVSQEFTKLSSYSCAFNHIRDSSLNLRELPGVIDHVRNAFYLLSENKNDIRESDFREWFVSFCKSLNQKFLSVQNEISLEQYTSPEKIPQNPEGYIHLESFLDMMNSLCQQVTPNMKSDNLLNETSKTIELLTFLLDHIKTFKEKKTSLSLIPKACSSEHKKSPLFKKGSQKKYLLDSHVLGIKDYFNKPLKKVSSNNSTIDFLTRPQRTKDPISFNKKRINLNIKSSENGYLKQKNAPAQDSHSNLISQLREPKYSNGFLTLQNDPEIVKTADHKAISAKKVKISSNQGSSSCMPKSTITQENTFPLGDLRNQSLKPKNTLKNTKDPSQTPLKGVEPFWLISDLQENNPKKNFVRGSFNSRDYIYRDKLKNHPANRSKEGSEIRPKKLSRSVDIQVETPHKESNPAQRRGSRDSPLFIPNIKLY